MKHTIKVVIEEPEWRDVRGLRSRLAKVAQRALERGTRSRKGCSLTIVLTSDEALRTLNRRFRRKNKATNVLSFPAMPNPENYLGDIAIALGVARREAKEVGKHLSDHAAHLAAHGVLHLLGYDHERAKDAHRMERLEARILAEFDIPDPYDSVRNSA